MAERIPEGTKRRHRTISVENAVSDRGIGTGASPDSRGSDETQNNDASSTKVDVVDENESNETSNIQVDEVDKNKCGEASGPRVMKSPREKAMRFLRYGFSAADVEQVTETPEQQLSAAPETAEQGVNVPHDAAQQRIAEQVVNVPDETEPQTQLDREPLNETQPVVQPKAPPENSISRATRAGKESGSRKSTGTSTPTCPCSSSTSGNHASENRESYCISLSIVVLLFSPSNFISLSHGVGLITAGMPTALAQQVFFAE